MTAALPGTRETSPATAATVLFGAWSQLLIGYGSATDVLANPFADSAYARGRVPIRAMPDVDVAVRHASSFAYPAQVDEDLRMRVATDLVLLSVAFSGFKSEQLGDWRADRSDQAVRRAELLSSALGREAGPAVSAAALEVIEHLTPAERQALEALFEETAAEGRELTSDPLALCPLAAGRARAAGYSIPAIVEPPEQMRERCL